MHKNFYARFMRVLCTFYAYFMRVLLDENYTHILCRFYARFKQVYFLQILSTFYADFMHVFFLMRVLLAKFHEHFLNTFVDSAYYSYKEYP